MPQRWGLCALQVRLRRSLLFAPARQLLLQRLEAAAAGRPDQGAAQPGGDSALPQAGARTPASAAGPAARGGHHAAAAGGVVPREGARAAVAGSVAAHGGPGAAAAGSSARGGLAMELGETSVPLQPAAHAEAHGSDRAAAAGAVGAHDGAPMREGSISDSMDMGSDGVPPPPPLPPPQSALPPPPPLLGVPPVTPAQAPLHGAAAGSMHAAAAGLVAAAVGTHAAADSLGAQALASEQLAQQGQVARQDFALQEPYGLEKLTHDLSSLAAIALPGAQAPSNGSMGEVLGRHASEKWCGPGGEDGERVRQKHACAGAEEGSKLHALTPEVLERRVGSEGVGDRMDGALREVAGEGGRSIVAARSAGPGEQRHAGSGQCPPMDPRLGVPGGAGSQERAPKAQPPSSLTELRSRKPSGGPAGGQRRSASPARPIRSRECSPRQRMPRSRGRGSRSRSRSRSRQHSRRRSPRRGSRSRSRSRSQQHSRRRSPRRGSRSRSRSRSRQHSRRRSPRHGSRDGSREDRSPSRGHVRRAECNGARQGADRRPPGRSWAAGSARAHEERATSGTPGGMWTARSGTLVHAQEQPNGAQGAAAAAGGGAPSGRRVFDAAAGAHSSGSGAAGRGRGGPAGATSNGLRGAQHQASGPGAASRLGAGQPAVRLYYS